MQTALQLKNPGVSQLLHRQPHVASCGSVRHYTPSTWFDAVTTVISWGICAAIVCYALAVSAGCRHWFVLPLFLCGVVLAHDAVNWFRGKLNAFDPVGIIGLLGFHFFFLANLLQVIWDFWLIDPRIRVADMRPWIGWMAFLNLGCLLLYRYLRDPLAGNLSSSKRKLWIVDSSRFKVALFIGLIVSAALQVMVYASWGGIANYMHAFEVALQASGTDRGMIYAISESFPILLMMGYTLIARRRPMLASWPALIAVFVVYITAVMLFGGLRGSRSNTVWALFWAAGMVHFMLRPLSRKVIFSGLVVVTAFLYVYGFYKAGGLTAVRAIASGTDLEYMERKTGRNMQVLLIGDLARGEMHGFVLRQLFNPESDYELALGRTYYATMCRIVPSFIWSNRPYLKNLEGTEIQYGKGTFDPQTFSSSFAWGLGAEAMMNFGVIGVPIMFLFWTLLVGRIRKWVLTWDPRDTRS